MKRGYFLLCAIFIAVSGLFAQNAHAYTATYKQSIELPGGGSMTHEVWLYDDKMRIESVVDYQKKVLISRKDAMFTYIPDKNIYIKHPALPPGPEATKNPIEFVKKLKTMEKETLGTETMNGYTCDVYRYRDDLSGSIVTVWVWQGKDFPVKIVFAGGTVENMVTFRDIKLDIPIPAEMFELPKGANEYDPNSLSAMFESMMQPVDESQGQEQ